MSFLSSTWPFDLPPGPEFLGIYIPLAIFLAGLGVVAAMVAARQIDGPVLRASSASTSTAAPAGSQPLMVGRMPLEKDLLLLAWLRAGPKAVGEALYARAMLTGALKYDAVNGFSILPDVVAADRGQSFFLRALGAGGPLTRVSVLQAMRRAAWDLDPELKKQGEDAGLVRPLERHLLINAIGIGGALVAVVVGCVRIAIRAELDPSAVFPRNLVIAMGLTVIGALVATSVLTFRHTQVNAMLRWLRDVTSSMRADVSRGTDRFEFNTFLTASLGGLSALGVAGTALAVHALAPPAAVTTSSGSDYSSSSSSSSSSCGGSSSSCGGGSSSCGGGGSSCGGGGGCS
ncbi:MAG: hypothetical protein Q8O67_07185 [Deltaproteobacteria bacterium]|nr:hypothetical protein [Deltaproteobacteria bacterium]